MTLPDPSDDDAVILYVADFLLFKQQGPSFGLRKEADTSLICKYRGSNSANKPCACGVGCLIPDDEYDPKIEESGVCVLESDEGMNAVTKYLYTRGYHIPLMIRLQSVHDHALGCIPENILLTWWQEFVKMTYDLTRDQERSPCRDPNSLNPESHKDTAFKILNWQVPGVTRDHFRRLVEECQRRR